MEKIIVRRFTRGFFVSLPALLIGFFALITIGDEYYRPTYLLVCAIFLSASIVTGSLIPDGGSYSLMRSWVWFFAMGVAAWIIAILAFGVLNLTPLCIGQDNGDGINDLGLCGFYTILITLVFSPPILIVNALSAAIGSVIMRRLLARK